MQLSTKIIVYKSIPYYKRKGRLDYQPNGSYLKRGFPSLHRQIYIDNFGEIPQGYHIHHKDHNHYNNDPENLVAITRLEHALHHNKINLSDKKTKKRIYKWHNSETGQVTLRDNAAKMRANSPKRKLACQNCGTTF